MSQSGRFLAGTGGAPVETLSGDAGGPVGPDAAGNINVLGGDNITSTGNPGTNTITIDLDTNVPDTFTTDAGNAIPALSILNVLGTSGITTTGAGNTVTVTTDGTLADTYTTDAGNAVPAAGVINFIGGTDIATSGSGSTVTITYTGSAGAFPWTEVIVVGPTAMAVNNGYIANNGAQVLLTMPAVAAIGDQVRVTGKGVGGWSIQQNAGQTIYFGNQTSTPGAGGRLDSTQQRDSVELVCITANNEFNVISSVGNITVV